MSISQAVIGPGFLVDYSDPDNPGWVHVIEGSESNVVGLPLELLAEMLAAAGW